MSEILMPPSVSTDVTGEIPAQIYVLHMIKAEDHTKAETGNKSIHGVAEIVAPDPVTASDGRQVKVAGRKVDCYISVTPSAGNIDNSFKFLGKLQLLTPEGGFDPEEVKKQFNSGTVFFQGIAMSEQTFVLKPGQGKNREPALFSGKPISSGYRASLLGHEHIIGRVATPAGFVANPY